MGLPATDKQRYTIAEWLALEADTGSKYEYHEGELFSVEAMSGGTYTHALLGGNVIRAAGRALDRAASPCVILSSDVRLKLERQNRYVYPDAAILCEDPMFDEEVPSAIRNPIVVVEVLSPSSAKYDMGAKFNWYRRLRTLRDYVLVHQDEYIVEVRSRGGSGEEWAFEFHQSIDGAVSLPSLGVMMDMREVYFKLDLNGGGA